MSPILSSLVHVACKMTVSTICVSCVRCTMQHRRNLFALLGCVVISVLVLLSFLCCIGSYFHLMCFCFHLNLVVVVNCHNLTLHSIFLENLFLKLEETCPTQAV